MVISLSGMDGAAYVLDDTHTVTRVTFSGAQTWPLHVLPGMETVLWGTAASQPMKLTISYSALARTGSITLMPEGTLLATWGPDEAPAPNQLNRPPERT